MNSALDIEEPPVSWRDGLKRIFDETLKQPIDNFMTKSSDDAANFSLDRCEKTVQMRLYNIQKPQLALVVGIFLGVTALSFVIGFLGPPMTSQISYSAKDLTNSTDLLISNYFLKSPIVSPYCKKLWLIAKLDLKPINAETRFETNFNYSVEISGFFENGIPTGREIESRKKFKEAKLTCTSDECEEICIAQIGYLEFSRYKISLKFFGLENLGRTYTVKALYFHFKSYDPKFSRFEVWFRFIFVIVTFTMSVWFYTRMQPYPMQMWSMEQSWIICLSPMLVLFNNPIYPLIFLTNSSFPGIVDSLFQLTFFCLLLLFWLCVYHGIRQRVRHVINFYLPKLIIVAGMWFTGFLLIIFDRRESIQNLTFYTKNGQNSEINIFKSIFYVMGSIYSVYLFYMVVRSYKELRNKPFFSLRLNFFTFYMISVVVSTVASFCANYGVVLMLQEKFLSTLSDVPKSSAAFLAFYALINAYVVSMIFVYSPSPSVVKSSNDIPLIENDSEDELYVGMDYEGEKLRPNLDDNDDD